MRSIWGRYNQLGDSGLESNYKNCGSNTKHCEPLMVRAVLFLKYYHPTWGAGRIRVELLNRYDSSIVPTERSMQRWFKEKKLTEPKERHNEPRIGRSKGVHNIWQADAKERFTLLDGRQYCYLTITDECSGAWLDSIAFPYARISQVPLEVFRSELVNLFERWGKPGALRVDNGAPLGVPTMSSTSATAMWLIAMDVDVILNKPACPTENAKVERMQRVSANWAEIAKRKDLSDLQQHLSKEAFIQREKFKVKRLQGKTRLDSFPELETSRRLYDPTTFNAQRVYDFLSKKIYIRKASSKGMLMIYEQLYNMKTTHKGKIIHIRLNPKTCEWCFFDDKNVISVIKATHLAPDRILNLTVCQ